MRRMISTIVTDLKESKRSSFFFSNSKQGKNLLIITARVKKGVSFRLTQHSMKSVLHNEE